MNTSGIAAVSWRCLFRSGWASRSSLSQPTWTARLLSTVSFPSPSSPAVQQEQDSTSPSQEKEHRIKNIKDVFAQPYPRFSQPPESMTCQDFREKYDYVQPNETVDQDVVVVQGRVQSARLAGSKLMFFDILHNGSKLQVLCNKRLLEEQEVDGPKFRQFYHALRRGDSFSITGKAHRTSRGELSLLATALPTLLAPCLHTVPLWSRETADTAYDRHVELLASPSAAAVLRARATIVQTVRRFFTAREFMEVNTPVLAAAAGGAVARPFATSATDLPGETLALRIAPELWLKRLVVGGFDRVFEIGPSFRNEGVDKTHNPEFMTCESYQAFADLEGLMRMTEQLFREVREEIEGLNERVGGVLSPTTVDFSAPFQRFDFIPEIEKVAGRTLPDLEAPDAAEKVRRIIEDLNLPVPDEPTLPRLLDKLCGELLEPHCIGPTFIMNHPECLSPLSKSFVHPDNGQRVSARAELFVENRELVNLYEEENSPYEQRKKFQRQLDTRDSENATGSMDEKYLECLEWGLPPTGGWGCGIERLTMLFTGAKRIDDVLSFGNLRSVTRASR